MEENSKFQDLYISQAKRNAEEIDKRRKGELQDVFLKKGLRCDLTYKKERKIYKKKKKEVTLSSFSVLKLPVIFAGTVTIFEMMEAVCIPYNNSSSKNFRYKLNPIVAILTDTQILHHSQGNYVGQGQKSKCYS